MAGKILEKPEGFLDQFNRKPGADKEVTHYCPGCGHGRIHKLIAEAMEELEIIDRSVFISPVGCSVFGYYYFNCGNIQAAHGRAPAVGTAVGRSLPHSLVISYQGDGDLAAIGTAEILHAANRGESMTVFFVNNGIYGMTGGQMAPTSLPGQKTVTTPTGRDISNQGAPLRMSEIISTLDAPVYVERVSVSDTKNIMKAKRAITKALKSQKDGLGFSFVEILSACPTGWKVTPIEGIKYVQEKMEPYFPVKMFKDEIATRSPRPKFSGEVDPEVVAKALNLSDQSKAFQIEKSFVDSFKEQKLRIAGFGGQGVLMAGTTLAYLGMEHDLEVTWLPSYGPEMRGGTANCHVVLSNKKIGSPVVEKPNVLIAMNGPSLDSFENIVEPGGLIIVNSSVATQKVKRSDVKVIYIPMTQIAEEGGVKAASNMVALTAYFSYTKAFSVDRLKDLLKYNFKKKDLVDKNIQVIDKAHKYVLENCM